MQVLYFKRRRVGALVGDRQVSNNDSELILRQQKRKYALGRNLGLRKVPANPSLGCFRPEARAGDVLVVFDGIERVRCASLKTRISIFPS
jgi:hypothetical protein